jgi:hypothetical protein
MVPSTGFLPAAQAILRVGRRSCYAWSGDIADVAHGLGLAAFRLERYPNDREVGTSKKREATLDVRIVGIDKSFTDWDPVKVELGK